jgi:hypothetical protein
VVVSTEPYVDFGSGHGRLIVTETDRPDRVIIERADRVIYVLDTWLDEAAAARIGWAEVAWMNPWHKILRIRGTSRTVAYDRVGSCGPRVTATLMEQPD